MTKAAKDVLAAIEATEVVPAKAAEPVTLKRADAVEVPPIKKSYVLFVRLIAP